MTRKEPPHHRPFIVAPHQDDAVRPVCNPQELLSLGMDKIAYIRPITLMGRQMYAVHAANGTPLTLAEGEELALHSILSQELEPVRLQ